MQVTARFVIATILIQTVLGFALAWLIDKKFRGHGMWTTIILLPMMLSPAVVGNFWTFLYQPQIGLFNYVVSFFTAILPSLSFQMLGDVTLSPWAIVLVDTWMWTSLRCSSALRVCAPSPTTSTRPRRSTGRRNGASSGRSRCRWRRLHHAGRAVPRHRELQDVRHGEPPHRRGTGSTTEVASITLKREAFEKWRTGYSSAFAIILFVTVFGLANIYVKALNRVKQR